jgi:Nif-specific regulatory protein
MSREDTSISASRTAPLEAYLVLRGVPGSFWAYPILTEPQTIGRHANCAIRVGDRSVSREHASIWQRAGALHIRDLGSSNGTRVNDQLVDEALLRVGDSIQLGEVVLVIAGPQDVAAGTWDGHPTKVLKEAAPAAVRLGSDWPGVLPLREEIAALYSLGGTLGSCAQPAEATGYFLDWMCEWLGVDRAAAIFPARSGFRVEARGTPPDPAAAKRIHWAAVRESLERGATVRQELEPSADGPQATTGPTRQVLVVPLKDIKPQGVIYAEWALDAADRKQGYPELIHAAVEVLSSTLGRLPSDPASPAKPAASPAPAPESERIVLVGGENMLPVFAFIRQAAAVDALVLITGETGTGKELVARAIHKKSGRSRGPFITRNCGALPESLFENELFGHEPGAFTGAAKQFQGVFEQADGGTLFLDEIGEIPLHLQSKLLRVLEAQAFQRIGGSKEVSVNVRIIAATNRNLAHSVAEGKFRSDLYYRLQVLVVHLAPLRERSDDIRRLAEHFLGLAGSCMGTHAIPLSPEALRKLEAHDWPGNVRELRNTIERAVIQSGGKPIAAEHIILTESPSRSAPIKSSATFKLEELERQHILHVLASVGGNKAKAASLLGIDRTTLHRKLQRLNDSAD